MGDLERICHNFDMRVKDIIYFSVNNWDCGINYPDTEIFRKWLGEDEGQYFMNDEWCKENKLCAYLGIIDMSFNYTVSAPKEWVEKNCPELLTNYSDLSFYPRKEKSNQKMMTGINPLWIIVKKILDVIFIKIKL